MKLKHKIGAILAGTALLVTGGVVADSTVSAVPSASAASNYVMVQGSRTLTFWRNTSGGGYSWSLNPGQSGSNFDMIRIPAGKCVSVGWWSFTVYCSPASYSRWQTLPGGNLIAKANW